MEASAINQEIPQTMITDQYMAPRNPHNMIAHHILHVLPFSSFISAMTMDTINPFKINGIIYCRASQE